MSSRLDELAQLRKVNPAKISPEVLQTILLDEVCGRLDEMGQKLDKLGAFITFMGPMVRMFKRDLQYQYATVPAGSSVQVYLLKNPEPDNLVGIITQVANDWFPHTYLEWFIDYLPKRVEYSIADIEAPKEYERGIPFHSQIKWVAHNEDIADHVFGVLNDGFFIDKKIYNMIIGE